MRFADPSLSSEQDQTSLSGTSILQSRAENI
jgi:hypothetical protein